jgi:hypothetical protein
VSGYSVLGCYVVGVLVCPLGWPLRHVLFSHFVEFLREFGILFRAHFFSCVVFGLGSKCIHGTTIKYTKGNRIERGFNLTNRRGSLMQGIC